MGPPPCRFALVGMGSLARDEITPYSDFEHIIALNNFQHQSQENPIDTKEYFRWYSVIFHIIILNLQETTVSSVCIPSLNDHSTPNGNWFVDKFSTPGISFDGLMPHASHIPLGKTQKTKQLPWTTELIKPVDEMVKYLEAKDIKQGYKLGDLLTKTCFVDGEEEVFRQFSEKVKLKVKQDIKKQRLNVEAQLREDLEKFDIYESMSMFRYLDNINIKRVIYRSITLFVSGLGRLHDLESNSGIEIIEILKHSGKVCEFGAHRLSHAIAVACYIRVFIYMSKKKQDDEIYKEHDRTLEEKEKLRELTKVAGQEALIDSFVTISVLRSMFKNDALTNIWGFGSMLKRQNVYLQMCFMSVMGLHQEEIRLGEKALQIAMDVSVLGKLCEAYVISTRYQKCLELLKQNELLITTHIDIFIVVKLFCLMHLQQFEDVLKESDLFLKSALIDNCIDGKEKFNLLHLVCTNGVSKYSLEKFNGALSEFRLWFKLLRKSKILSKSFIRAVVMQYVSCALIQLGRRDQGLHWAREGLNFLKMIGIAGSQNKMFEYILLTADFDNYDETKENLYQQQLLTRITIRRELFHESEAKSRSFGEKWIPGLPNPKIPWGPGCFWKPLSSRQDFNARMKAMVLAKAMGSLGHKKETG